MKAIPSITLQMIKQLDGEDAAEKYIMTNLETPEIREIAVNNAFENKDYILAENLCMEGKQIDPRKGINGLVPWCVYLEKIYRETGQTELLESTLLEMLIGGLPDTFGRLKELYLQQGRWEEKEELLWDEVSKAYHEYGYAELLSQHKKLSRLMEVLRRSPQYIYKYAKQLAKAYPEEIQNMYVNRLLEDAEEANQRPMYRKLCGKIKAYKSIAGKEETNKLVKQLMLKYPRRPAMLDELEYLRMQIESK